MAYLVFQTLDLRVGVEGGAQERESKREEIKNKKMERIKQNLVMNKNVTNTFC